MSNYSARTDHMHREPNRIIPIRLGSAYCFYLPSPNGAVLIDAGGQNKEHHLRSVLTVHEHDIRDIQYIILTHTHHDHVGSLAEIKRSAGAKVFVHKDESAFLKRGRTPLPKGTLLGTKTMVSIGKMLRIGSYPAVEADFVISDELQLSEFDYSLHIISTPGHTAGSLTIIVDDDVAFVGDTMFNIRPDTVYPPFANDEAALLSSWNRLLKTSCRLFYPGHGKPIERAKLERSYEKAIKHVK
ncbi:MBL fold metallo-hydrolase [candidate division KSB1 bacterium]|nr:MBL fold metallo-hydrolase [candidate division KSB1 bacterium]